MASLRHYITLLEAPTDDVTVWHVTRRSLVPRIMRQGLLPKRGARSRSVRETTPAIYVFPDSLALEDALSTWLGDEFEGIPLSLLELTVPRDWLTQHAIRWEATITQTVPPARIRVLVADLDAWTGVYPGTPPPGWFPAD